MIWTTIDVEAKLKSSVRGDAGLARARRMTTSPRFASSLLATVLVWEFCVLFLKARRKPFWYDELLTFHVSNLHPFSLLWRALQTGVDGMPPAYYVIVRLGRMIPGDPEVTLRLPSILGYILTLLGVYWFLRKRLPASAGLAAVFLITLSPFREYALEARSYSLLVGFLAISAVLWQRIGEKRFMTPLFALFLTLAVSFHHLAVVAISAFGVAELTWTLLWRRVRWGVWASCVLASAPFFLDLPLITHLRDVTGKHFWSAPQWDMIGTTYADYLGLHWKLALVFVLFFGMTAGYSLLRMLSRLGDGPLERDCALPEIILIGGFLFYPALLVILTKLLNNSGYTPRYGLPAVLGLVVGSVYLIRPFWLKPSSACLLVALLIVFAVQEGNDLRTLYRAGSTRLDGRWSNLARLSRDEPGIPVVIASGHRYLEAAEYAPPELRDRLVVVVNEDIATRLIGSDTCDKTMRLLARFIPLRVEDLAVFQAADQRFILSSGGTRDWLTHYLVESRYHLRLLAEDAGGSIYIVDGARPSAR